MSLRPASLDPTDEGRRDERRREFVVRPSCFRHLCAVPWHCVLRHRHLRCDLAVSRTPGRAGILRLRGAVSCCNVAASATLILPVPWPGAGVSRRQQLLADPGRAGSRRRLGPSAKLTGYLAGYSGRGCVENQAQYQRVQGWMRRYGLWVIFVLALIPNPLFDVAGIICGVLRIRRLEVPAGGRGRQSAQSRASSPTPGAGTINLLGPALQDVDGKVMRDT